MRKLGKQHVQYHQKLVGIGNALRRRDDEALTDFTSYELLCTLLDAIGSCTVLQVGVQ